MCRAQVKIWIENIPDSFVLLTKYYNGVNYICDTLEVHNQYIWIPENLMELDRLYTIYLTSMPSERLDFYSGQRKSEIRTSYPDVSHDPKVSDNRSTEALYFDLKVNRPLLDSLMVIMDGTGSPYAADSVTVAEILAQIRTNRMTHLDRYAGTVWAESYLLDTGFDLPYFSCYRYAAMVAAFSISRQPKDGFIDKIIADPGIHSSQRIFGRKVNWSIDHPGNRDPDSLMASMDLLFKKLNPRPDLVDYALRLYYLKFNTMGDHHLEKAMVHFWERYMESADISTVNMLDEWRFGKLIQIRKHTLIGESAPDFHIRNADFERIQLTDIDGDYRILVFWEPERQDQWEYIARWRDDFNESGLFSLGYRMVFISVSSDEGTWYMACANLNILDQIQYINRLNDPGVNLYFDSDLRMDCPLTYLIDANGVILDKFRENILDYHQY